MQESRMKMRGLLSAQQSLSLAMGVLSAVNPSAAIAVADSLAPPPPPPPLTKADNDKLAAAASKRAKRAAKRLSNGKQ